MHIYSDTSHRWVHEALSYFNEKKQENLVLGMIGTSNESMDVLAELQSAKRLDDLGFTILKEELTGSAFKAQWNNEDPFWVVSCSLSRFLSNLEIKNTRIFKALSKGRNKNSAFYQGRTYKSIDVHVSQDRCYTPVLLEPGASQETEDLELLRQLRDTANKCRTGETFLIPYRQYDLICTATETDSKNRLITAISSDQLLQDIEFAKKRAIKHCLKKIPDNSSSVLICMNVNPEPFAESIECLGIDLFKNTHRNDFTDNKKSKRVSGVLLSSGDPTITNSLNWTYYQNIN